MTLKRDKVRRMFRRIRGTTVTVIGDVMLDRYLWGDVERISPEAPVPVVEVDGQDIRLGGAANVAWNVTSLGGKVNLVAVVGKDRAGAELKGLLGEKGIATRYIEADSSRVTTEKMRVIAHKQHVVRADFESVGSMSKRLLGRLADQVAETVRRSGAVIVSDYGKGMVNESIMDIVRAECSKRSVPIFVDPKEGHFALYKNAFLVTPNKKEAGGFYNRKIKSVDELEDVGRALLRDLDAEGVLITRGEEGMTLFEKGKRSQHFPTRASEVYDVTGAGDTVVGVVALATAAGIPLYEAIELANISAGVVVREVGTAAVTVDEIVRSLV
ncbi:D-glycero-beta-D-manno-heptose-7-phosphate kinase [bacterium]|nr:MAG: D-glycero-beta-D-manno-heptose-7-phosphate kinase [bacterium]